MGATIVPKSTSRVKVRSRAPAALRADALRLLGIRQRSAQGLKRRLIERGFPVTDVERTIEELKELKLLDDARFARALIEETTARKPVGRLFLARKLRQASVDERTAALALAAVLPPGVEATLAKGAAEKKLAELSRRFPESPTGALLPRLARFLAARGFTRTLIDQALSELGMLF